MGHKVVVTFEALDSEASVKAEGNKIILEPKFWSPKTAPALLGTTVSVVSDDGKTGGTKEIFSGLVRIEGASGKLKIVDTSSSTTPSFLGGADDKKEEERNKTAEQLLTGHVPPTSTDHTQNTEAKKKGKE